MIRMFSAERSVVFAAMALGLFAAPVAMAQDGPPGMILMGARAAAPTCPAMEWRVLAPPRGTAGHVKGFAYFADMTGVGAIDSSVDANGAIKGTITSVSGKGPSGQITGLRGPAGTHVELKGTGCSNLGFDIRRWTPGTQALTGGD